MAGVNQASKGSGFDSQPQGNTKRLVSDLKVSGFG